MHTKFKPRFIWAVENAMSMAAHIPSLIQQFNAFTANNPYPQRQPNLFSSFHDHTPTKTTTQLAMQHKYSSSYSHRYRERESHSSHSIPLQGVPIIRIQNIKSLTNVFLITILIIKRSLCRDGVRHWHHVLGIYVHVHG